MKTLLMRLATLAVGMAFLAVGASGQNANDAELKAAITALHTKFEKVEKACGGHAGMKH